MEFLTTCCFIVKINHCLKCGCIYPQQCQGFVVKYEFSVLFLLFFVRFSSTSLSEIWSEIFIFLETSTLECFLFVFCFLLPCPISFVAPYKDVDSLILELQLLSLSLCILSLGTLEWCLCILCFLLLCTDWAPGKDVEWPILDSQLLSLSLFILSFNTEWCLLVLRFLSLHNFCSRQICWFTDFSLIIQTAICTCCQYVVCAIISFTLDWHFSQLINCENSCKFTERTSK